ncbi:hypothetical protein ACHAAC_03195 [Aeromicrobium sp. CF4.19]|uniref:hypothetical protein n=1 Tax=Aeromicrobium sp. CF4.19 TaxID=3373082 RepID=UPI003EE4FA4E
MQIARALAQEPTELLELVTSTDTTTVMALHDLNLAAAYCDEVVVLHEGRVRATGRPAEVIEPRLIAEVYAVEATVVLESGVPHVRFTRPL